MRFCSWEHLETNRNNSYLLPFKMWDICRSGSAISGELFSSWISCFVEESMGSWAAAFLLSGDVRKNCASICCARCLRRCYPWYGYIHPWPCSLAHVRCRLALPWCHRRWFWVSRWCCCGADCERQLRLIQLDFLIAIWYYNYTILYHYERMQMFFLYHYEKIQVTAIR